MKFWPTTRQALIWIIIMFANIFLFGFRNGQWGPNYVFVVATFIFAIIFVISWIREHKNKE